MREKVGDKKDDRQSQVKRPYRSPILRVYGEIRLLTAAGSRGLREGRVGGFKL
jgi:hypothetical protein